MPVKNIDEYIARSAAFAQPVLKHLRELVHKTVPEATEAIKWGMPFFDYKGPFVHMAAFKAHCSFGFWKAPLMKDAPVLQGNRSASMGHLGRITGLKDLPGDGQIIKWLLEAKALNDEGIKAAKGKRSEMAEPETPLAFQMAINKNKNAKAVFANASPSFRKEYNTWVAGAKQEATRDKRIAQAVEWIAEGKGRNWRYEKC